MHTIAHFRSGALIAFLTIATWPLLAIGQTTRQPIPAAAPSARADGEHDFDFAIGTWKTHVTRLVHPLTGSSTWVQYDGTTIVRPVWGGRANFAELDVTGPSGRVQAASLRLYDSDSKKWSLNISNPQSGVLSPPSIGEFNNGRGEFYDQETLGGRTILVRFVFSQITANSNHVEQAFSADWGKTWEVNLIVTDTRIKEAESNK
jgi:hypothetical protein